MKTILLPLIFIFVQASCAHAKTSCGSCLEMKRLLKETQQAHKAFASIKNPLSNPPTQEEETWHIALGNAANYVCSFEPQGAPPQAVRSLVLLVVGIYKLKPDANMSYEMFLCFHSQYHNSPTTFKKAVKNIEANQWVQKVLKEGAPDAQDSAKP